MWNFGDFGPGGGSRHWQGGQRSAPGQRRVRRGNVRAAILSLLNEQPMHGYQIIQEISRRSGGRWNPSPGSIYPTLQMLEDEGLVIGQQSEDGKRLFELTDDGRAEVARSAGASHHKPWEEPSGAHSGPPRDLMAAIGDAAGVLLAAAASGTEEQRAQIVQLLSEFRQTLTAIVPEAADAGPFAGRRRGPWGRSGPGWTFGVPDWIFAARESFGDWPNWMGGAASSSASSDASGRKSESDADDDFADADDEFEV